MTSKRRVLVHEAETFPDIMTKLEFYSLKQFPLSTHFIIHGITLQQRQESYQNHTTSIGG